MATASQSDFTSAAKPKDDKLEPDDETMGNMNGNLEIDPLLKDKHDLEAPESVQREDKVSSLENGQHELSPLSLNGEQQQLDGDKEPFPIERRNGRTTNESQEDAKYGENGESENTDCNNTACKEALINSDNDENEGKDDKIVNTSQEKTEHNNDENDKSSSAPEDIEKSSGFETKETPTPGHISPPKHSPDRGVHHSGGCHKFLDEESRAEYMKIKSEVIGEAETSESEDEEESATVEHIHPGSHSSPDSKTKAEYRKIKYEVTGEALTSESEDENTDEGDVRKQLADDAKKESSSQEWLDIFGNGLLRRRILRAGKGRHTRPERGQVVMLCTAGRLEDGTPVDWNQCLEFILGEGEVIQAWDVAVALIELNEVCELVTDGRYAYGEQGRDGDHPIPANAKITYEIELLAVRDGPDMDTMPDEERINIGDKKRELGNDLFVRGDYSAAINCYQRAIKFLTPSSDEKVQELKMKCWNNLAAAQLKIKAHTAALTSCMQVLSIDPDNVKALFRKGKVLTAQGDLQQAITYVKKANHNEPGNKTIRNELINLRRQLTSQNQKERNMYERMVGGLSDKNKSTSKQSVFSWSLMFGATVVVFGGVIAALYMSKH